MLLLNPLTALGVLCCGSIEWSGAEDSSGQSRASYDLVISCAEAKLQSEALAESLLLFQVADQLEIFEVPNYEALPAIAELHCRLGETPRGRALVKDLECILDVDAGITPCYVGGEPHDSTGERNPALSDECFDRMCSEIYLSYYDRPTPGTIGRIDDARARLVEIARLCHGGSGMTAATEDDMPPQNRAQGLIIGCAENRLRQHQIEDALLLFQLADQMALHETPNYDALIGVAEARCRMGDAAAGLAILDDYTCMLEVEAGIRVCYTEENISVTPGRRTRELTEECFNRMCSEVLLEYYRNPTEETLLELAANRRRAAEVDSLCRTSRRCFCSCRQDGRRNEPPR